ncbi:Polygalacturonase-1 non-catalytic subunit beta [Hibiscus syriacus]|uniref:Polygalacturonase-1 non-catalytic subunit beta n=1 Tax=Hibiscus syriacus TaxID=106335 RepID=A0A6A2Z7N3_HIBSY|nr:Polygalacturonase-1 non-catalytic subunit beta [Hibiscus syriacus]
MEMSRVPYASAVGSLMFAMICTRPDIAQAVGVVSRYMANPGKEHWNTSVVATSTTEAEYVAATQAIAILLYPIAVFRNINTTFKDYAKNGVTFSKYNESLNSNETFQVNATGGDVNRWVEQGKFFREEMLKQGTTIASVRRAPGETKRCVGSAEDMLEFAASVLGPKVDVRTMENVNGSKTKITIGTIRNINGGKVTKSVSCHQNLYPYLLYYCHSVPNVRVYEADILDPDTRVKINRGVAICHLDTSSWSSGQGAFLALGPGRIEVCHWIFENDMT